MSRGKRVRYLTVYSTGYRDDKIPSIVVQGRWLQELDFKPGDHIKVECDDGTLTIRKAEKFMIEDCVFNI